MTKKGELPFTGRTCVVCRGEIRPGSVQCCVNGGCPVSEGMLDLLTVYIPLLILSY